MAITLKAHAKINWALNITGRRPDGYHLLDMLMQTVALCDEITLSPAEELTLTVDGIPQADPGANLVVRAANALRARAGRPCGARIDLVKRIPERAGLGGGSADCAAALRGLNRLWALGLSDGELMEIGAGLGADVPFCLTGGLARVRGIGERIDPVPGAPMLPLALVRPGEGLSTAAVFALWDRGGFPATPLDADALARAVLRGDLAAVDALGVNALTAPALALLPEIGAAMDAMRSLGACAVFMTGSGSTVVGAFPSGSDARRAAERLPGAIFTHTLGDGDDREFFA